MSLCCTKNLQKYIFPIKTDFHPPGLGHFAVASFALATQIGPKNDLQPIVRGPIVQREHFLAAEQITAAERLHADLSARRTTQGERTGGVVPHPPTRPAGYQCTAAGACASRFSPADLIRTRCCCYCDNAGGCSNSRRKKMCVRVQCSLSLSLGAMPREFIHWRRVLLLSSFCSTPFRQMSVGAFCAKEERRKTHRTMRPSAPPPPLIVIRGYVLGLRSGGWWRRRRRVLLNPRRTALLCALRRVRQIFKKMHAQAEDASCEPKR